MIGKIICQIKSPFLDIKIYLFIDGHRKAILINGHLEAMTAAFYKKENVFRASVVLCTVWYSLFQKVLLLSKLITLQRIYYISYRMNEIKEKTFLQKGKKFMRYEKNFQLNFVHPIHRNCRQIQHSSNGLILKNNNCFRDTLYKCQVDVW